MKQTIEKQLNEADINILMRSASNYGYGIKDFTISALTKNQEGFKITREKDKVWFIVENIEGKGMISSSPDTLGEGFYDNKFSSGHDFLKQFQQWMHQVSTDENNQK